MTSGLVSHDPKGEHYIRVFRETVSSIVKNYDSDMRSVKAIWSPENFCRLFIDAYTAGNLTIDELQEMVSHFCRGYIKLPGYSNPPSDSVREAVTMIVSSVQRRFIFKEPSLLYDVPYARFDGDFCSKFFWERQIQTFVLCDLPVEYWNEEYGDGKHFFVLWLEERGFVREPLLDNAYVSRTFRLSHPNSMESTCALVVPPRFFENEIGRIDYRALMDGDGSTPPVFLPSVAGGYALSGIVEVKDSFKEPFSDFKYSVLVDLKKKDFFVWVPSSFLLLKRLVTADTEGVSKVLKVAGRSYFVVDGRVNVK